MTDDLDLRIRRYLAHVGLTLIDDMARALDVPADVVRERLGAMTELRVTTSWQGRDGVIYALDQ